MKTNNQNKRQTNHSFKHSNYKKVMSGPFPDAVINSIVANYYCDICEKYTKVTFTKPIHVHDSLTVTCSNCNVKCNMYITPNIAKRIERVKIV